MREVIKEVVCIDGNYYPKQLTNGKTYSVVRVHDIYYDIIDDSGEVGDFYQRRFKDIEPVKNNEIMSLEIREKDTTQVWKYPFYVIDTENEKEWLYEGFSWANCQKYIDLIKYMK